MFRSPSMTREQQLSGSRKPLTPLEIYNRLERSNCGRCLLPSCLAFAAAVVAGTKKPSDCPFLSPSAVAEISQALQPRFSSPSRSRTALSTSCKRSSPPLICPPWLPALGGPTPTVC
ncbi:(Fe-S)-binding protein [Thermodesulfobacteriota bacterium B35]